MKQTKHSSSSDIDLISKHKCEVCKRRIAKLIKWGKYMCKKCDK